MQCSLQVIADAGSCQGLLAPQDLHQFTALPILAAAAAVQQQVQFIAVQCSTVQMLLHKNTALGHSVAVKYNVSPKKDRLQYKLVNLLHADKRAPQVLCT